MPRKKSTTAPVKVVKEGGDSHPPAPSPQTFVLRGAASYMTPWANNYHRGVPFAPAHDAEHAFVKNHPDFEEG